MSMLMPHLFRTRSGHTGPDEATADDAAGTAPPSGESLRTRERLIDEELAQSFPASDPPSWVQGTPPVGP